MIWGINMIEVIKHGDMVQRHECNKCGCIFSFNSKYDTYEVRVPVKNGTLKDGLKECDYEEIYTNIRCPECRNELNIMTYIRMKKVEESTWDDDDDEAW